jgi:hypothetical protein
VSQRLFSANLGVNTHSNSSLSSLSATQLGGIAIKGLFAFMAFPSTAITFY